MPDVLCSALTWSAGDGGVAALCLEGHRDESRLAGDVMRTAPLMTDESFNGRPVGDCVLLRSEPVLPDCHRLAQRDAVLS